MADNRFRLDPALVQSAVAQVTEAGEAVTAALAKLNGVLDHFDGCWGDDDIGKAFEQKYRTPSTTTRKDAEGTTGAITGAAAHLADASRNFQQLDEESAARVKSGQ
ncbi:WXG100 family type VII secretion target [Lentzea sp. NPDC059081]|uniref:WXG100 family type VII secretion target n=1 Tax=Lentzea sp. NPDC059081 TaxID=3346719 RepID=UPI0036A50D0F